MLDRIEWIDRMIAGIRSLPLQSLEAFKRDQRNIWSAESCLRRSLEAVFDIARHLLAKGFAIGVSEYKETAERLAECGVLSAKESELMKVLAGYRNRLVHFYHEVNMEELYEICSSRLDDVLTIRNAFTRWLASHSDMVDESL